MRASTAATLLVGLLAPFTLAAPTAETALTPGGFRVAANIHQIPSGGSLAHVGSEVHVFSANGTVVHKVTPAATKVKAAVSPEATGWVAYASWLNTGSSPISSFTTTWKVPAVPAANHGQTVFLFNSIEPNSGDAILQPVLQFGPSAAGGGSFWALATWYLVGDQTFFTTPVRTTAGSTLNGVITLTSSSGSLFNYNSAFSNVAGTTLTVTGAAQLTWATETLEAYAVTSASDYPTGSTVFSGINLKLASGAVPTVAWSHVSDTADGLTTTVNTNGATNAQITIAY
ncbi:hypothetical protein B0H17DRAFT_1204640 [Mycena rosella]|uniref:Uncharacterized protein n=1 Tax=Mycena rosella TaxID=1033263 RepID=A0AAD7D946_MYCRO|nr:hypothetical protein B0H17DRAFT_1204640 [Mycena rosella]